MPTFASADLRRMVDWQKGVRGYLDYQDEANKEQLQNFADAFRPTESSFDVAFAAVMEAAKFSVATELRVRENRRAARIGQATPGAEFSGSAVEFNSQGIKSANRARRLLAELPPRLRDLQLADASALDDGKAALTQNLIKFKLTEDDFSECLQIWDEVAAQGRVGAGAVFDQMSGNLERLGELRAQSDRGNSPHSPLPWWKYVVIAAYVGASVFAVIACFVWSACTWVWPAISATAPWIFGIIDRGC